eukprot:COSAG04_NODE_839_length_9957_cov_18.873504_3_plen_86_part_00
MYAAGRVQSGSAGSSGARNPSTDRPLRLGFVDTVLAFLQSTPQTQSANVTESSGEEEEAEEEAPALAEDAGSEEAAGEGQEETAG